MKKLLPWLVFVIALLGALAGMRPPAPVRQLDLAAFGQIPVLEGGRVKPLDSLARNSLLVIRSKQSVQHENRTVNADEWLADVLFRPQIADTQAIFVIDDPDVLGLIGIKQSADRYYSFKTLLPYVEEIQKQSDAARAIEAKKRTRFQNAIVALFDRLFLYHRLKHTVQLADLQDLTTELADLHGENAPERHDALAQLGLFRALPGPKPGEWRNIGEALREAAAGKSLDKGLELWAKLATAYQTGNGATFNTTTQTLLQRARPDERAQALHEQIFNQVQPFYAGMVIYVLALLVLFVSWLRWAEILQPLAFSLLLAGLTVHTGGLISRIVVQGRPPVTKLYSSAIFVGWSAVLLGSILERIYRKGFGTAVAAASGFAGLLIAHNLAADGDTMEMMRAVLDSNFWLATHVVTITIGYSGTFLAGAIAIGYTLRKHIATKPDPAVTKVLVSMGYGIVCFSLLFSFVGTVLGGIWADQSWGRFWGWDPKENGALLIVLWNAIILHARWGGFAREKGTMAMAIFGNIITSLSWFGVNMLGVGLHSYGFMDKAFWALLIFAISQLLLIGLCLAPPRFWQRKRLPRDVIPAT